MKALLIMRFMASCRNEDRYIYYKKPKSDKSKRINLEIKNSSGNERVLQKAATETTTDKKLSNPE
jgi:hypothetical protein